MHEFYQVGELLLICANSDFMPRMLDSNVKLWKNFLERLPLGLWEEVQDSERQEIRIWYQCSEVIPECMSFKEGAWPSCLFYSQDISSKRVHFMTSTQQKALQPSFLPEAEESEAAGVCRPGLCPQAQLAASSTLLAGPPSGQHLCWLHGDHFGEAASGKLEEHRIWEWRRVFKSHIGCQLIICCWVSQHLWTSVYPLVKWDNSPPQRCHKDWDSDARRPLEY